jgi:hypothetical protein
MRSEIIELFFNDEMRDKYHNLAPYKKCKKCEQGLKLESDTICKCSLETILSLVAEIPERYNVDVKLSKTMAKQAKEFEKFMVLTGEEKYMKLFAYHIAKQFIKDGRLVRSVSTISGYRNDSRIIEDVASMNKADLIIFEDIYKKQSSPEYTFELKKRIGQNKPIVFLGKTDIIVMDDDFLEIEVDSADITVE